MNRSESRPARTVATFLAGGLLAVTMAAIPVSEADSAARLVHPGVLRTALAARPLDAGVATDQIAFFEERLAERPGDVLSLRRIASTRLLRFRAYNDLRELEQAEDAAMRLTAWHEADAGAYATRASVALARHDFAGAMEAALRYRSLAPRGETGATWTLFDALWASGRYEAARGLLEETETPHPSVGLLSREARLVDGLGRVSEAAARMERVVRMVDGFAEPPIVRAWARVELGHFLHHSGSSEAAVARYVEALDLVPGYPAALEALGWLAYGVDEDLAAAEALFLRSAEYGAHLDLYPLLAEIAEARGAPARARAYERTFMARIHAPDAETRMFWRPLAQVLAADTATLGRALEYAEMDLAQRQDRGAWATRGWILHRLGRSAEAVEDMERALAWGSPPPDILHQAGVVSLESGLRRRGVSLLREALDGRAELGPVVASEIEDLLAVH
ncbi:MAG: hypothetical protein RH859_01905 [Longimicrobiales bacterium]